MKTYLYQEQNSNSIRCLALSSNGEVYDGEVQILLDGRVQLELQRHSILGVAPMSSSLESISDRRIKQTIHVSESAGTSQTKILFHER
jgi:hypothetical protein